MPIVIHDQDTRSAGAYINAQYVNKCSPLRWLYGSRQAGLLRTTQIAKNAYRVR